MRRLVKLTLHSLFLISTLLPITEVIAHNGTNDRFGVYDQYCKNKHYYKERRGNQNCHMHKVKQGGGCQKEWSGHKNCKKNIKLKLNKII